MSHPVPAIESLLNNVGCLFVCQAMGQGQDADLALGDKTFVPGIDLTEGLGLISPEDQLGAKIPHPILGGLRASDQLASTPVALPSGASLCASPPGFQGLQEGSSPCPAWMILGDGVT